jgi:hypothetical protein
MNAQKLCFRGGICRPGVISIDRLLDTLLFVADATTKVLPGQSANRPIDNAQITIIARRQYLIVTFAPFLYAIIARILSSNTCEGISVLNYLALLGTSTKLKCMPICLQKNDNGLNLEIFWNPDFNFNLAYPYMFPFHSCNIATQQYIKHLMLSTTTSTKSMTT